MPPVTVPVPPRCAAFALRGAADEPVRWITTETLPDHWPYWYEWIKVHTLHSSQAPTQRSTVFEGVTAGPRADEHDTASAPVHLA